MRPKLWKMATGGTSKVMDAFRPVYDFNLYYAQQLVADIADENLAAQPVEGVVMNHPAFLVGHVAWSLDNAMPLAGGAAVLLHLRELWGTGSTPADDRDAYPSKPDLLRTLEVAHARLAAAIGDAPRTLLMSPSPEPIRVKFPTTAHVLLGLMTSHYATHLGQLSAWRRAMNLPPVF